MARVPFSDPISRKKRAGDIPFMIRMVPVTLDIKVLRLFRQMNRRDPPTPSPGRFLDPRVMYAPTPSHSRWETSRTILRQYAPTDEGEFLNLWGDPVVQRLSFVEDLSPARTAHFLQKTIQATANGAIFFLVVEDKERHEFLGHISLNFKPPPDRDATVGIALKARYRGRGFGTELMHWLITYAFRELGLRRISLTVVEDNIPALRMYKKM